jgi:DNA-binding transcriptional regulator PaaX
MRITSRSGWGIASKAVATNPGISAQAKGLYLLLTTYADARQRVCWPSVATLAEGMGCSDRTIKTLLAELVREGVVERSAQGGRTTRRSSVTRLLDYIVVTDD